MAIELEVVNSSVPLMISRETMKKMRMTIDLEEDTAIVGREKINLRARVRYISTTIAGKEKERDRASRY